MTFRGRTSQPATYTVETLPPQQRACASRQRPHDGGRRRNHRPPCTPGSNPAPLRGTSHGPDEPWTQGLKKWVLRPGNIGSRVRHSIPDSGRRKGAQHGAGIIPKQAIRRRRRSIFHRHQRIRAVVPPLQPNPQSTHRSRRPAPPGHPGGQPQPSRWSAEPAGRTQPRPPPTSTKNRLSVAHGGYSCSGSVNKSARTYTPRNTYPPQATVTAQPALGFYSGNSPQFDAIRKRTHNYGRGTGDYTSRYDSRFTPSEKRALGPGSSQLFTPRHPSQVDACSVNR